MKHTSIKLTQQLRNCVSVLAGEVMALNKLNMGRGLNHNRVSGAIYHRLNRPEHAALTYDEAVALIVVWTNKENLPQLLAEFDQEMQKRESQAAKQVLGIVNNLVPADLPDRDQVMEDTLRMLERFRKDVCNISGIRKMVQRRVANGHMDLDEDAIADLL